MSMSPENRLTSPTPEKKRDANQQTEYINNTYASVQGDNAKLAKFIGWAGHNIDKNIILAKPYESAFLDAAGKLAENVRRNLNAKGELPPDDAKAVTDAIINMESRYLSDWMKKESWTTEGRERMEKTKAKKVELYALLGDKGLDIIRNLIDKANGKPVRNEQIAALPITAAAKAQIIEDLPLLVARFQREMTEAKAANNYDLSTTRFRQKEDAQALYDRNK